MQGLLIYLRANEHMANLAREAERERLAASVKRQGFLVRVAATRRHRKRADRLTDARLSDLGPAKASNDAATVEA